MPAPTFDTVAEVIHHYRTNICAVDGRPVSMRDFAGLLGNVSHNAIALWERGEGEPGRDDCAEWWTHQDPRVVAMVEAIFVTRSWRYIRAQRDAGRPAVTLPALMLGRA